MRQGNAVAPMLFIIVFLLAGGSQAEEELTLKEAVNTALKENNQVKAKVWSVESRRSDKEIARSHLLPRITFEERFSRTNNPTYAFMAKLNQERFQSSDFAVDSLNDPDVIDNFMTVVSLEQPLYVRKAQVAFDMAGREVMASELELQRTKERVGFDVFQACVQVMIAREYETVAHKGLEDVREHQRIAEVRSEAGLGLYSDVLRARVAKAEAERAVVEAEKNAKVAGKLLGILIGKGEPVAVAPESVPVFSLSPYEVYQEASRKRADLKATESRYDTAQKGVKLAEADYFPVLGVGGSYQLDDHDNPFGAEGESWQVMAFLRVTLFDGLNRENQRAKAFRQAREAGEYLEGMKKQIDYEIYEAYLSVQEAEKKQALANAAAESAEEGMRLTSKRYENALVPLVSLLDAQASLDRARADVVAMRGRYLIALARLEFVSGRLLQVLELGN